VGGFCAVTNVTREFGDEYQSVIALTFELNPKRVMQSKITQQDVILNGACAYNAKNVKGKRATVTNSGPGAAIVRVNDQLNTTISGVGYIEYIGSTKVTKLNSRIWFNVAIIGGNHVHENPLPTRGFDAGRLVDCLFWPFDNRSNCTDVGLARDPDGCAHRAADGDRVPSGNGSERDKGAPGLFGVHWYADPDVGTA
jgi:hypothetical protein